MTDFLDRLAAIVGPNHCLTAPEDMAAHLVEERGLFRGAALAVVKPGSTAEVAEVVRLCARHRVPMVPQGGNTGLVGGGVPFEHGREVVLSLTRLDRIRHVDPANFTMTVEAGVILADVQRAAEEAGCLFPLSLAAEGTCRIGGNLSSNAGGVAVLRYGNARDLCLGLEVVLPDGQVWNGLRALRKDNTGYDLKHLFIGAEGTLGVITAAVLKLYPQPRDVQTAFTALTDMEQMLPLLARARAASGDAVTAFELIPRIGLDMALAHIPGVKDPLAERHDWYALIELSSSRPDGGLRDVLENLLAQAIEDGICADAAVAESLDQRKALWRIRETIPEAQKHEGGSIKHDVSVPVSAMPAFIRRASAAVEADLPGIRTVAFGHVGDGNVHFNLSQPPDMDKAAYLAQWGHFNHIVHEIVTAMDGSVSAEHGIGRLKRDTLPQYKAAIELGIMRKIKGLLDPDNIMNPGKVV